MKKKDQYQQEIENADKITPMKEKSYLLVKMAAAVQIWKKIAAAVWRGSNYYEDTSSKKEVLQ